MANNVVYECAAQTVRRCFKQRSRVLTDFFIEKVRRDHGGREMMQRLNVINDHKRRKELRCGNFRSNLVEEVVGRIGILRNADSMQKTKCINISGGHVSVFCAFFKPVYSVGRVSVVSFGHIGTVRIEKFAAKSQNSEVQLRKGMAAVGSFAVMRLNENFAASDFFQFAGSIEGIVGTAVGGFGQKKVQFVHKKPLSLSVNCDNFLHI